MRLTKEPTGQWYVPDGIVVRADNPVPADPEAIYAGVPDLAIEILSGNPQTAAGRAERERDLVEKRRAYAARGIPHYWIVEPRARRDLARPRPGLGGVRGPLGRAPGARHPRPGDRGGEWPDRWRVRPGG